MPMAPNDAMHLTNQSLECDMTSVNVHSYCKYYRNNISYCIQKNLYLPLYRKIKSLLYIQFMEGVRNKITNIHTPTWRTSRFIHINETCPCNTSSHSDTPNCMQHHQIRTTPSAEISLKDREIHCKYNLESLKLEGFFIKKFQFPMPETHFTNYI